MMNFNRKVAKKAHSRHFRIIDNLKKWNLLGAENQEVKQAKVEKNPSFFNRHKGMEKQ